MNARTTGLALAGAALTFAAAPTRAEPEPETLEREARAEEAGPWEITGRLRASRDALSLEVGGALLEVRIWGDPPSSTEPPAEGDPRARDFRASFTVDGKTTNLLLRFVPPAGEAPAEPR